jgi:glycosyltransferase involved in cell wall biosynthesis
MQRVLIGICVTDDAGRLAKTLAALAAHTLEPHRLLILGDGPDGPMREMLSTFRHIDQSNTEEYLGTAACFNRLIHSFESDLFVLLENGAEPGLQWLDRIVSALSRDHKRGLAGPSTNRSWNQQGIVPSASAHSSDPVELARIVARRFGSACRTLEPLYSLADFCYVVSSAVVSAIGDADAGYGTGPCWEMDYNIRAERAGYKGIWVCGAYVHRSPITARRAAEDQKYFEASKRRYQDKFCGLRLKGLKNNYRDHCRGAACANFAPAQLIAIRPAAETFPVTPVSKSGWPLASCIMPTYNRRPFVPGAVACFLAQDYPNLELIVADDGSDPIRDLLPCDARIRYIRIESKLTTGEKRNVSCQAASGEYILHWDDDDWYGPGRVSRQVAALRQGGAQVCGSSALYYYAPATRQAFRYQYRGTVAAWMGALAYPKRVWESQPFEAIQVAEDVKFLARIPTQDRLDLRDPALSIATIHQGNTSPKLTAGAFWIPENEAAILSLMGVPSSASTPVSHAMVSCIMPTWNRRSFIPLALACFRAQTYSWKELIVVDDGDDSVQDLVSGVPGVRYIRPPRRATIGAKRNAACEEARGDFIAHWDDDDWYSPHRLERQLEPLLADTHDLTGLTNSYVLEMPGGNFWCTSSDVHRRMFVGDIHGGTLVYRRDVWRNGARYPDISLAEDAALLKRITHLGKRILRIDNNGEFVYLRHSRNTWQFQTGSFLDPTGWKRHSAPPDFSNELLEAYRAAADSPTPLPPAALCSAQVQHVTHF